MTPTDLDIKALRDLETKGGSVGYRSAPFSPNTYARLRKMGFATISKNQPIEHVITPDGSKYLAGLDGKGPLHWRLVINGLPACKHGEIGAVYGCASTKFTEVERWKEVVLKYAPGARVEIFPGDCDPDCPKTQ